MIQKKLNIQTSNKKLKKTNMQLDDFIRITNNTKNFIIDDKEVDTQNQETKLSLMI